MPSTDKILFICTANYYRSRFAEMYFNHLAGAHGIDLRADSAALEMARWRNYNPGELSVHAIRELNRLGIQVPEPYRAPKQFEPVMLGQFARCIALSEAEHRPMATRLFPQAAEQFEYWTVEDVEFEAPVSALARIQQNVQRLIGELNDAR